MNIFLFKFTSQEVRSAPLNEARFLFSHTLAHSPVHSAMLHTGFDGLDICVCLVFLCLSFFFFFSFWLPICSRRVLQQLQSARRPLAHTHTHTHTLAPKSSPSHQSVNRPDFLSCSSVAAAKKKTRGCYEIGASHVSVYHWYTKSVILFLSLSLSRSTQ